MNISCQEEMKVLADCFVERRRDVVFFLMAMHHLRGYRLWNDGCNFIHLISTGRRYMMDGVYCYNFDDERLVRRDLYVRKESFRFLPT